MATTNLFWKVTRGTEFCILVLLQVHSSMDRNLSLRWHTLGNFIRHCGLHSSSVIDLPRANVCCSVPATLQLMRPIKEKFPPGPLLQFRILATQPRT